jgi:predicted GIY-YIG superfamily endonuclease
MMIDRSGYVYLVKSVTGHWKIGRTNNPDTRINQFEVRLPIEIELDHLILCYDMFAMERAMHIRFQHKRIRRTEWFHLTAYDIAYIKHFATQLEYDAHRHYIPTKIDVEKYAVNTHTFDWRDELIVPVMLRAFFIFLFACSAWSSAIVINGSDALTQAIYSMYLVASVFVIIFSFAELFVILRRVEKAQVDGEH